MPAPPVPAVIVDLVRRLQLAIGGAGATAWEVAEAAAERVDDDGAPHGLRAHTDVAGVEAVTVSRRWDSELPNTAQIRLVPGLQLTDLEHEFGPSRRLRAERSGTNRVVLGTRDGPATTMASVDADGAVREIIVLRED